MNLRWLAAIIQATAGNRKTIISPAFAGPILIRGGFWGGVTTGAVATVDFGYVPGKSDSSPLGNGAGRILENNVAIGQPVPYTRFNLHRLQNDVSAVLEGMPEFGGSTGPTNYRPLHFVIPGKSEACVAISLWNNTGGPITAGVNIEIVENIPQAFLDCLKHLVM